jgi:hypothetical protein
VLTLTSKLPADRCPNPTDVYGVGVEQTVINTCGARLNSGRLRL